eukprot:6262368-Amphidinium_carterae.1
MAMTMSPNLTTMPMFWHFRYEAEHCSPGRCSNFAGLEITLERISMAPWNSTRTDFKTKGAVGPDGFYYFPSDRLMGGKASEQTDWDDASFVASDTALAESDPVDSDTEHDNDSMSVIVSPPVNLTQMKSLSSCAFLVVLVLTSFSKDRKSMFILATVMAGGRMANAFLIVFPRMMFFVLCMQEVGLTKDGQAGLRAALKEKNVQCVCGQPSTWMRTKRGATCVNKGQVPGVAVIASSQDSVLPIGFCTEAANKWFRAGRCQLLQVGLDESSFL